ncbi:uncharacterized protein LOC143774830 [Ranitomeya variabilis]|uniref:uncharacterized protein LOC143774830 n=1 Tax=Ranitomeya variabilis TaxID=490064 RepID=UPI004055B4A1
MSSTPDSETKKPFTIYDSSTESSTPESEKVETTTIYIQSTEFSTSNSEATETSTIYVKSTESSTTDLEKNTTAATYDESTVSSTQESDATETSAINSESDMSSTPNSETPDTSTIYNKITDSSTSSTPDPNTESSTVESEKTETSYSSTDVTSTSGSSTFVSRMTIDYSYTDESFTSRSSTSESTIKIWSSPTEESLISGSSPSVSTVTTRLSPTDESLTSSSGSTVEVTITSDPFVTVDLVTLNLNTSASTVTGVSLDNGESLTSGLSTSAVTVTHESSSTVVAVTSLSISALAVTSESAGSGSGSSTSAKLTLSESTPTLLPVTSGSSTSAVPDISITSSTTEPSRQSTVVPPNTTATTRTTRNPGDVTKDCQNGGYYDGNKCICGLNFYGIFCEFIMNEIRPTVTAYVNVTVTVSNVIFTHQLNNPNSTEHKDFEKRFKQEMAHVYQEIPNYIDLRITKITEGSVVVEHLVLLHVSIDEYNNVVKTLYKRLNNTICTNDAENGDELCLTPNKIILPVAINPKEICSNQTEIPEYIQPYYSPLNVSGVTLCVSRCSSHSENPLYCNRGHCSVTNRGPQCYCEESSEFWYTGDHCQTAISKPGVYAGVTIGVFVLLVIITALAFISYRRRKESDKTKLIDYKRWNEDEWEKDDNSASGSLNSNFRPNLGTVNTNLMFTIPRPSIVPDKK